MKKLNYKRVAVVLVVVNVILLSLLGIAVCEYEMLKGSTGNKICSLNERVEELEEKNEILKEMLGK